MNIIRIVVEILSAIYSAGDIDSLEAYEKQLQTQIIDSVSTLTISTVGDIMCHSTQFEWARVNKDSFDFNPVYREVKQIFNSSDFLVGNLETVLGGKKVGYSGYPVFNTPDEFVEALAKNGFDIIITSNNHSTDGNKKGVLRTIDKIREYGMQSIGTYTGEEDRDSIRIFERNGIRFALLAYSYGLNIDNLPRDEKYLINVIDTAMIKGDIDRAKTHEPDLVFVYFHFGNEYKREPEIFQKNLVKKTLSYGADIIFGSSPHVVQPVQYLPCSDSALDTCIVVYSLGNFISNQRWRYSDGGVITNFSISKNTFTNKIISVEIDYYPIWIFKGNTVNSKEYVVFPFGIEPVDSMQYYLSEEDKKNMKLSFSDTQEIMNKYTSKPKVKRTNHVENTENNSSSYNRE